MNRIIFISIAVFLLVAPAFTSPVEISDLPEKQSKQPKENEVNGDVNRDVETIGSHESNSDENTDVVSSSVIGQSTGIITRIGVEGEFKCKNIVCPSGTQTCKYESKMINGTKNAEVSYKCTSGDGNVLLDEKKTEPFEEITPFNGFMDVSEFFQEMQQFMRNMFRNPFFRNDDIEDN